MAADVPKPHTPLVTFDDVLAAQKAITGMVVHTPTMRSQTLSHILGIDVWVKFENLQFTSSFKDRGACNRLLQLTPEEAARGVIAMSAGNHAQGVAYHATRLGIPSTIVMPQYTPNVKVAGTEALGARVVLHGADIIEAKAKAEELAAAEGLVWVPPFDDPAIIAGQGTAAIEMLEDAPEIDTIVVPVGGGGLIAGMAIAAAALRPDVKVIGVETELYPSMVSALDGGATPVPGGQTVAEGIAVGVSGVLTTPIVRELVAETLVVRESTIEHAMNLFLDIEKTVAEGAGAAGLAAVLEHPDRFVGRKVGLVLTGGNVDPRILASVIMRGLVRSGRLARVDVDISDIPGSLARVTTIIGELGGNIVEVAHQRLYSDLTIRSAVLELAIETRDRPHTERIIAGLCAAGYHVVNRGT
jgi:threonine dehydratase